MSGDMGRVVKLQQEKQLTAHEKYHALTKHFIPGPSYVFPSVSCGKQQRSFQWTWLSKYSGLVYSENEGGGYCKYCVLFGQAPYSVPNFKATLVTLPLTNLKKATEKLREHFYGTGCNTPRKYHLQAVEKAESFRSVMENKLLSIDQQLSNIRAEIVSQNRKKMKCISETVIFCGRQGIALCGHRDDWKHVKNAPDENAGNFLALLQFRVLSGDTILAEHLQSAHRNALYTSKTIQNEVIEICKNDFEGNLCCSLFLHHGG